MSQPHYVLRQHSARKPSIESQTQEVIRIEDDSSSNEKVADEAGLGPYDCECYIIVSFVVLD